VNGRPLSFAQVEQRRAAATRHGGRSPTTVAKRAAKVSRRLLKEQRLEMAELDGLARAALRTYAAAQARCELIDEAPDYTSSRERTAAGNSARLALADLKQRLKELGLDRARPQPVDAVARHLEAKRNGAQP
jgi:hypothetical protein